MAVDLLPLFAFWKEAAINTSDQQELARLRSEAGEAKQQAVQAARKAAKAQAKVEIAQKEAEALGIKINESS